MAAFSSRSSSPSSIAAIIGMVVGTGMLVAWAMGAREVVSWLSPDTTVKANTAVSLALTGAALLLRSYGAPPRAQAAGRMLAGAVCVIAGASLYEYIAGVDLGIDQLLFRDPWETVGPPGRMSVITALCLLALNLALISLEREGPGGRPAEWLALPPLALSLMTIVGFMLGQPVLRIAPGVTTVAWPTAATLLVLSLGVLLARPDRGIAALVMGPGVSGLVVRRFVPAAAAISLGVAWVDLEGEEAGLWNVALGRAAGAVTTVFLLGGVAIWTAAGLRRAEAAREREHARLRSLIDVLPIGVVFCDTPDAPAIMNPAARVMFGGQLPGCSSSPRAWRADTGVEAEPRSWGLLATLADGQSRLAEELDVESVDGRRTILVYATPVCGRDGKSMGACGGFVDVTARKRAERELEALKDDLEQQVRSRTADLVELNRELETFAYSVSHDLRAPLRAADGFAAMLEEGAPEFDAERLMVVRRIRTAMRRMAALIDAMLALSRAGRAALRPVPLDLATLAREVAAELEAGELHRAVEWEIPERLPAVGDPSLIRTALANLLNNAWKYTRGRDPARIALRQSVRDGQVEFTVSDNGAGFDMAYVDRLFQPFERLHRADEFEGSGVGLATVRRIVERHGGRVRAEGEPGKGASFSFTLGPSTGEATQEAEG